jgi:hypothetical protein
VEEDMVAAVGMVAAAVTTVAAVGMAVAAVATVGVVTAVVVTAAVIEAVAHVAEDIIRVEPDAMAVAIPGAAIKGNGSIIAEAGAGMVGMAITGTVLIIMVDGGGVQRAYFWLD